MTKTYTLRTLGDVFDQVPADRIEACMAEIAQGMTQAKVLRDLLDATSTELGGGNVGLQWPESCEWTDDDANVITIGVHDDAGMQLTMETKPNVESAGHS